MYSLNPPHVFIHRRVYENPQAMVRLECMLAAMGNPSAHDVDMAGVGGDFAYSQREGGNGIDRPYVCQGGWGIHTLEGLMEVAETAQIFGLDKPRPPLR